jgi:hypothetical protein
VTGELEKLSVRDRYNGSDQVHTANGTGMQISNVGHTIVHTPTNSLFLNKILHVPNATKSLASVHKLAKDNNAYLEFHPDFFCYQGQGHEEDPVPR